MEVVGITDEVLGCRDGVVRDYRSLERSLMGVELSIFMTVIGAGH